MALPSEDPPPFLFSLLYVSCCQGPCAVSTYTHRTIRFFPFSVDDLFRRYLYVRNRPLLM